MASSPIFSASGIQFHNFSLLCTWFLLGGDKKMETLSDIKFPRSNFSHAPGHSIRIWTQLAAQRAAQFQLRIPTSVVKSLLSNQGHNSIRTRASIWSQRVINSSACSPFDRHTTFHWRMDFLDACWNEPINHGKLRARQSMRWFWWQIFRSHCKRKWLRGDLGAGALPRRKMRPKLLRVPQKVTFRPRNLVVLIDRSGTYRLIV